MPIGGAGSTGIVQILKWDLPQTAGSVKQLKIVCLDGQGNLSIVNCNLDSMIAIQFPMNLVTASTTASQPL